MSGKIQNEDIKSVAEIVAAGGTSAQLPNDSKVYVTGNGLNQLLSAAITAGNLARSKRTFNTQVGTTYTFALSDGSMSATNPMVLADNGSPQTYTVPPNSSVAFPVGTQIDLTQYGAGKVTFAPGVGVTIYSKGGNLSVGGRYVGVTLIQTATDVWLLIGNLVA